MDKKDTCIVTGVLSGAAVLGGAIALVVATGGVGLILGGVAVGAGISGTVNSVQQAHDDSK